MILVTLGTQDKPFVRLLEMVQQLINKKIKRLMFKQVIPALVLKI